MFVRFRQSGSRIQASLIETRRIEGKVQHEHVAGFGSIDDPPTVKDRVHFWRRLHERLGQLSNRLDAAAQAKVLSEVHAHIPMPTIDDIRGLQLQNTEADEKFWSSLRDMRQATANDHKQLLATIQQAIAIAEGEAKAATEKVDAAKERASRLRAGEDIAGGLSKQPTREDLERILREAGRTMRDIIHADVVRRLNKLGGFEEYVAEVHKRHRLAEYAAARAVLRRLT
jgi:hypothetical protein